jgi:hypothetical protein
LSSTSRSDPLLASVSADMGFYISFGLVLSARLVDVPKIREAIERLGGKIAFQTVTKEDLFLLREYQVERILDGDLDQLAELHKRKQARRVEK